MNDIEYTAQVFTAMYESLFFSFFGTIDTAINSDKAKVKSQIPVCFQTHSYKCPAKSLVINSIAELHSPHPEKLPEVKKTVRSYLSRSKLIDFEKLDDIYAAVRDQHLDSNRIKQYKENILDIADPQYLIAIHLYMKYHKVYIRELFDAFCGMIITGYKCKGDVLYYCLTAPDNGEEIIAAVRERIYGINDNNTNSPQGLYRGVCNNNT